MHDWIGAVFIPRVKLAQVITFVQDYNHHKDFYGPEVVDARILSRNGEHFVIYMRLKKGKMGVEVVLNTEHDAQFSPLDQTRWHSRSRTTRIAELENPGTPKEREKPVGGDGGYMWSLNSYWRFVERDGGSVRRVPGRVAQPGDSVGLARAPPHRPHRERFAEGLVDEHLDRDAGRRQITAGQGLDRSKRVCLTFGRFPATSWPHPPWRSPPVERLNYPYDLILTIYFGSGAFF